MGTQSSFVNVTHIHLQQLRLAVRALRLEPGRWGIPKLHWRITPRFVCNQKQLKLAPKGVMAAGSVGKFGLSIGGR